MKNKHCKAMGIMLAGALIVSGISPALASAAGEQIAVEEPVMVEEAPEVLTVFVDIEEGDDTADGSSAEDAVKTIEQASKLLDCDDENVQKYMVFVGLLKGEIGKLMEDAPKDILGVTEAAYEAVVSVEQKEEAPEPVETPKADEAEDLSAGINEDEPAAPVEDAAEEKAEAPVEEIADAAGETALEGTTGSEAEIPTEEAASEEQEAPIEEAVSEEQEAPTEEAAGEEQEAPIEEAAKDEPTAPAEQVSEEDPVSYEEAVLQNQLIEENREEVFLTANFSAPLFLSAGPVQEEQVIAFHEPVVFAAPVITESKTTADTADHMLQAAVQGLSIPSDTQTAKVENKNTETADIQAVSTGISLFSIGGLPIVGPGNYQQGTNTETAGGNTSGSTNGSGSNSGSSSTNKPASNQGGSSSNSASNNSSSGNKGTGTSTGNRTNTTKTETTVRGESVNTGDTAMVLPLTISSVLSAAVLVFLAYLQTVTKRAEAALAWRKFREEHPILEDFDEE